MDKKERDLFAQALAVLGNDWLKRNGQRAHYRTRAVWTDECEKSDSSVDDALCSKMLAAGGER